MLYIGSRSETLLRRCAWDLLKRWGRPDEAKIGAIAQNNLMKNLSGEIVKLHSEIENMSVQLQTMKQFIYDEIKENEVPVPVSDYHHMHVLIEEIQTNLQDLYGICSTSSLLNSNTAHKTGMSNALCSGCFRNFNTTCFTYS